MNSQDITKVLVLDGDMVPALTVSRSLSGLGYNVVLGSPVERPLASYSRSTSELLSYPDPLEDSGKFIEWLARHISDGQYALVIPVTERSLLPIKNSPDQVPHSLVAMAGISSIDAVLDKAKTFEIARSLGIPVPKGVELCCEHDLESLAWDEFPVVIKPAASVASKGVVNRQLSVTYAFDRAQLRSKLSHYLGYGRVILQQRVAGAGVGVEVLVHKGEVVYAFQHKRLHEVPLTGGGSTLRESVPLDKGLLEASKKLMRELNWHGVAMVEFKMDEATGQFYLMEINGRFWGSLPLAAAAGADFPGMLIQMLLEGKTKFPQGYKEGIVCRRLAGDIRWYEMAIRKAAPKELSVLPSVRTMIKDLLLVFSPRHSFDVQSFSDPLPGIVELTRIVKGYWHRISGIMEDKWFHYQQQLAWQRGKVKGSVANANRILFLCYGNINRSAIAELLAVDQCMTDKVSVLSAGFHAEDGRVLDEVMNKFAASEGLDSSDFRSSTVSQFMLDDADVIFVMEKQHFDRLNREYSLNGKDVFLLGGAEPSSIDGIALPDPYGKSDRVYEATYTRIKSCINVIGRWLRD